MFSSPSGKVHTSFKQVNASRRSMSEHTNPLEKHKTSGMLASLHRMLEPWVMRILDATPLGMDDASLEVIQRLASQIQQMLKENRRLGLKHILSRANFADLTEVCERYLNLEDMKRCLALMPLGKASEVIASLETERRSAGLLSMPASRASRILRLMPDDDAVDILQELPLEVRRKLLGEMPTDDDTHSIHQLLMEEPDTAAGLMSTDYVSVLAEKTVGEATEEIRQAYEKDFIYYVYLVTHQEELVGVVSVKTLLLRQPETPLKQVAMFDVKHIEAQADQSEVVTRFRKYHNLLAMPVVDETNRLQGIITLDDVLDVLEEETVEDIYQASGIFLDDQDERNLLSGPVWKAVRARLPWLSVTIIGQMIGSLIITQFHDTVIKAVVAVSFMPLLSGLSGNIGSQTDVVTVRGLALNQIRPDNFLQKLFRELMVALSIAIICAFAVGIISYVSYRSGWLSLLLMVSILVSLCTSAVLGMVIPFWIRQVFRYDPAGIGAPFLTTFMDILTFSVYLLILSLLYDRVF
ncbi:MAG: magnesium transporter [Vampirovibrionales bacterium]